MKILLIIIGIILFTCFFLPLFSWVFNLGNLSGMALGIMFFIAGIKLEDMSFTVKKWSFFVLFLSLWAVVVSSYYILLHGKSTAREEKVLIVLGCKVRGDEPSIALVKRVNSAYNHLLCNPESVAILSGGQGRDENLSEALCMKQMLCDRGISESRLLLEDKSINTDENIRFSAEIIKRENLQSNVAVVSSEYHLYRAKRICRKYGLNAAGVNSRTRLDLLPTFLLREAMAVVKDFIIK